MPPKVHKTVLRDSFHGISNTSLEKIVERKLNIDDRFKLIKYIEENIINDTKNLLVSAVENDDNKSLEKFIKKKKMDKDLYYKNKTNSISIFTEIVQNDTDKDIETVLKKKSNIDLVESFKIILQNLIIKYAKKWAESSKNNNEKDSSHSKDKISDDYYINAEGDLKPKDGTYSDNYSIVYSNSDDYRKSNLEKILRTKLNDKDLELIQETIHKNITTDKSLKKLLTKALENDDNDSLEKYIKKNKMDESEKFKSKYTSYYIFAQIIENSKTIDEFIKKKYDQFPYWVHDDNKKFKEKENLIKEIKKKSNIDLVDSFRIILQNLIIKYTKEWAESQEEKLSDSESEIPRKFPKRGKNDVFEILVHKDISNKYIKEIINKKDLSFDTKIILINYLNSKLLDKYLVSLLNESLENHDNKSLEKYIKKNKMDKNKIFKSKAGAIRMFSDITREDSIKKKSNIDLLESFRIILQNLIIKYTKEWAESQEEKEPKKKSSKKSSDSESEEEKVSENEEKMKSYKKINKIMKNMEIDKWSIDDRENNIKVKISEQLTGMYYIDENNLLYSENGQVDWVEDKEDLQGDLKKLYNALKYHTDTFGTPYPPILIDKYDLGKYVEVSIYPKNAGNNYYINLEDVSQEVVSNIMSILEFCEARGILEANYRVTSDPKGRDFTWIGKGKKKRFEVFNELLSETIKNYLDTHIY